MASSLTRILNEAVSTPGILRDRASWKALSGQISMNFVLGGAISHWAMGSTCCSVSHRSLFTASAVGIIFSCPYHNLGDFEVNGNLSNGPHPRRRVEQQIMSIDGPEDADDGGAVSDRTVVVDLAPRWHALLSRTEDINNALNPMVDLPLFQILQAWERSSALKWLGTAVGATYNQCSGMRHHGPGPMWRPQSCPQVGVR